MGPAITHKVYVVKEDTRLAAVRRPDPTVLSDGPWASLQVVRKREEALDVPIWSGL